MLANRFAGLAGQTAVAMQNSHLMDEIRHQTLPDALTGLSNRTLIMDRARHMLARAPRHEIATAPSSSTSTVSRRSMTRPDNRSATSCW